MFKNGMRPVHPGEVLREDFLIPLKMSANALATALKVPAPRINLRLHMGIGLGLTEALGSSRRPGIRSGREAAARMADENGWSGGNLCGCRRHRLHRRAQQRTGERPYPGRRAPRAMGRSRLPFVPWHMGRLTRRSVRRACGAVGTAPAYREARASALNARIESCKCRSANENDMQ